MISPSCCPPRPHEPERPDPATEFPAAQLLHHLRGRDPYYQHAVEIEVYLEEGDAAARDAAFDNLLQQIGAVLEADPTLGGLGFGLTYGRPETGVEAVAGAPAIKSATLTVTIDYETEAPLS